MREDRRFKGVTVQLYVPDFEAGQTERESEVEGRG